MAILQKNFEEKPYNRCITCDHIGLNCDGPNFLAMDIPRLSEWCRLRKEYLHRQDPKWTNAFIAEQAKMSKVSVDRFLSGNAEDIKTSTVTAILKVLVDGSWGQYPCAWASSGKDDPHECDRLKEKLEEKREKIVHLEKEIEHLEEQLKVKDQQIASCSKLIETRGKFMKRKDVAIATLSFLLFICVAVIITALIIDRLNIDIGFFWLDKVSTMFTTTDYNTTIKNMVEWRI